MNTRLTLTLDQEVIEEAKKYANSNGRSLSSIIEEYLKSLTRRQEDTPDFEVSPLVQSLWGQSSHFQNLKTTKSYWKMNWLKNT